MQSSEEPQFPKGKTTSVALPCPRKSAPDDAELKRVIAAWPAVSDLIRRAVIVIVSSVVGES